MTKLHIAALALFTTIGSLGTAAETRVGSETSLPLPRFVSMKAEEGNVRRGPSTAHRIDWVFQRRHMPVQIVAEHGHWRRVVDRDGAGGWMHYSLLSGNRTVIVTRDLAPLHKKPSGEAKIEAYAEYGVVAELEECSAGWCEVTVSGQSGWTQTGNLWGLDQAEAQ